MCEVTATLIQERSSPQNFVVFFLWLPVSLVSYHRCAGLHHTIEANKYNWLLVHLLCEVLEAFVQDLVGLLEREQPVPTQTTQKDEDRHPCIEWNSNSWFEYSSGKDPRHKLPNRCDRQSDWQPANNKSARNMCISINISLPIFYSECCHAWRCFDAIAFLLCKANIDWLIDWLIISVGSDVSEPRQPTGLLFIPQVMWAMVMMIRLGKTPNSSTRALWQSYQKRNLGASRRNGRRSENFAYQHLRYVNGTLKCSKTLRYGASGFTFLPKEGVLRMFIALRNLSQGLNPRPLGSVASTLTTTPPRRHGRLTRLI
jgi:hypothetical protein